MKTDLLKFKANMLTRSQLENVRGGQSNDISIRAGGQCARKGLGCASSCPTRIDGIKMICLNLTNPQTGVPRCQCS